MKERMKKQTEKPIDKQQLQTKEWTTNQWKNKTIK